MYSHNIYFFTSYHTSVYEITYKTISHTNPEFFTAAEMGEYTSSKKGMESKRNLSLNPSSIHTEISLENDKIFHLEKSFKDRTWADGIKTVSHSLTWEKG